MLARGHAAGAGERRRPRVARRWAGARGRSACRSQPFSNRGASALRRPTCAGVLLAGHSCTSRSASPGGLDCGLEEASARDAGFRAAAQPSARARARVLALADVSSRDGAGRLPARRTARFRPSRSCSRWTTRTRHTRCSRLGALAALGDVGSRAGVRRRRGGRCPSRVRARTSRSSRRRRRADRSSPRRPGLRASSGTGSSRGRALLQPGARGGRAAERDGRLRLRGRFRGRTLFTGTAFSFAGLGGLVA